MKPYARWTHALAIPFLVLLSASAWYPMRAAGTQLLFEEGGTSADFGVFGMVTTLAAMFGALGGGLLALASPWAGLLVGLAVATVGGLAAAVVPGSLVPVALGLAAFGHAMVGPCLFGAAARALDGPRAHLRDAVFVAAWTASNVGALSVGLTASLLREEGRAVLVGGAVVHVIVLGLGAVAAGVAYAGREEAAPKPTFRGRHLAAVAALLLVVVVPWAATLSAWDVLFALDVEDAEQLFTLNPLTVVVGGGLLVVALLLAHALGVRRFPTLVLVGVGCALLGATTLGILMLEPGASAGRLALAVVVTGVGEVLVLPLLFSRLAGDLPYRLGALSIAIFLALGQVPGLLSRLVGEHGDLSRPLAWIGVVTALVVGLALIAAGAPARRLFEPPSDEPEPKQF